MPMLHGHKITEVDDLIAFIEETQGAADVVYGGDGTVAKTIAYWDVAKTLLLAVETYTRGNDGSVTSILFDIYNADGVTIDRTLRYDFTYNADGTLAGDTVTVVFP